MARACATCEWFEESELETGLKRMSYPSMPDDVVAGYCHRYPPVPDLEPGSDPEWLWTEVNSDDWCGEYQPRHPAAEDP